MNLVFLFLWLFLFSISYRKRADLFSPMRVFLFNILLFWGGAFLNYYTFIVSFYFLLILGFGFVIWWIEGPDTSDLYKGKIHLSRDQEKRIFRKLWILTAIPILAQLFLIQKMGGLESYVWSMNLRVKEWAGLGIYIILIRSILVINLIYFVYIIKLKKITFTKLLFFLLNFLVFIAIALLSNSRSTLLVNIVLMFICYYYYVRPIKTYKIALAALPLLLVVLVLGAARNGYAYKNGEFQTGLDNDDGKKLEAANFEYGLFPMQVITEVGELNEYYYGGTYLTAITNLVPRKIWPGKPDPAGVLFTKNYHNIHDGYSNYSTGIIPEAIMNFGFLAGPIMAFVIIYIIYLLFMRYSRKKVKPTPKDLIIFICIYVNVLFLLPTYFHGEFTVVTHTIFLGKIVLIVMFSNFLFYKENMLAVKLNN
jgi:oligosaccharide repeat unit polymerase